MPRTKEATKVTSKNGIAAEEEEAAVLKVTLGSFEMYQMTIHLVGVTPLLSNAMSLEMLGYDSQTGKPLGDLVDDPIEGGKKRKSVWDAVRAFDRSRTKMPDGRDAVLAAALVKAVAEAGRRFSGIPKVHSYGQIRLPAEFIPLILEAPPKMALHTGKNRFARDAAIPISRAEYWPWSLEVPVIYWSNTIDQTRVINLFRRAGFAIGIGGWRPEKGGIFGQFDVERVTGHEPYRRYEASEKSKR